MENEHKIDGKDRKTLLSKFNNEKYYDIIFHNAPDSVFFVDDKGIIVECSKNTEILYKLPREKIINHHITSFMAKESISVFKINFPKLASLEKVDAIIQIIDGKGDVLEIWRKAIPLTDHDGKFIGALAFDRDITEVTKIQKALKESEERWRTVVENEPECVKLIDREGRLLEMNLAGLAMIQATFDQVRGKKAVDLVAEKDRAAFNEMVEGVFRGETRHLVFDMIGLQGRRLTLEATSAPLMETGPAGGVKALLGVTRDITERKKVEEALRESEERYRDLFNNAPDAIFLAEVETGIMVDVNQAAIKLTGISREELIGHKQTEIHPKRVKSNDTFKLHAVQAKDIGTAPPFESIIARSDGSEVSVEITARIVQIQGRPVLQGIFRDVSERKRIENIERVKRVELEKFGSLSVDRELRMMELKKEVNLLLERLGEAKKYKTVEVSGGKSDD